MCFYMIKVCALFGELHCCGMFFNVLVQVFGK